MHRSRGAVCDDSCVDVRSEAIRLVAAMFVLAAAVGGFRAIRYDGFTIKGENMAPTFEVGDDVLVRHDGSIEPGDVVIATIPTGTRVLSRVVGIGGDVLVFKDGRVKRNGVLLDEAYLAPGTVTDPPAAGDRAVVPPATLYLMGDNRGSSTDSRRYGPVSVEGVLGSVADAWWWPPAD